MPYLILGSDGESVVLDARVLGEPGIVSLLLLLRDDAFDSILLTSADGVEMDQEEQVIPHEMVVRLMVFEALSDHPVQNIFLQAADEALVLLR